MNPDSSRAVPSASRPAPARPVADAPGVTLRLVYRPPLAWAALQAFLVGRGAAGAEAAEGTRYLRTVALQGHRGWIVAEPSKTDDAVLVQVSAGLLPVLGPLQERLRRLFDLDADPAAIHACLQRDARLVRTLQASPGLRVPGALDGFELALRAVLGQQVTVKAATTLYGRFARAFGEPAQTPHTGLITYAPQAERIAQASLQQVIDLGLTQRRAQTALDLSRAVAAGELDLEGAPAGPALARALERLLAIPGIGPWTAQYVAMRALRDADAFPHSDLALMKALSVTRPREALLASESWRPWRAYAALHLWHSLQAGG